MGHRGAPHVMGPKPALAWRNTAHGKPCKMHDCKQFVSLLTGAYAGAGTQSRRQRAL